MGNRGWGLWQPRQSRAVASLLVSLFTVLTLTACTSIPSSGTPSASNRPPLTNGPVTERPSPSQPSHQPTPANKDTKAPAPTPGPTPTPITTPTPTASASQPTHAFLGFRLELVGAVNPNDAYALYWSKNDGPYAPAGLCGYSGPCAASTYDVGVPSVPLGSSITWYFERQSLTTTDFAMGSVASFSQGMTVSVTCTYNPQSLNGEPTCERNE